VDRRLIEPGEISGSSILCPAPEVGTVEVDDRVIVVDEWAGRTHELNPTASIVWRCLDGEATIAEIVDDLSAAFGADRGQIDRDVTNLVRDFGALGLLDGVGRRLENVPIDAELVEPHECPPDESVAGAEATFDDRYLAAPPNR